MQESGRNRYGRGSLVALLFRPGYRGRMPDRRTFLLGSLLAPLADSAPGRPGGEAERGLAPVEEILAKLSEKGDAGALSVELFRAEYVRGDPFVVASELRRKCEAVMSRAGVL